jgi:adenylate kinase
MVIVFFGPPGSGKGTQAQKLKETMQNVAHVSTGELFRQEIAKKSELGCLIEAKMQAGELIADKVVMQLVSDVVQKNAEKQIIFDGFPRTLNQAIALDTLLGVKDLKVDIVFDFDIDVQVLADRISGRYTCAHCGAVYHELTKAPKENGVCDQCGGMAFDKRQDDNAQVLQKRVKIYQDDTLPIKEYYGNKGVLKRIDASLEPEVVAQFINAALKEVV